MSDLSARERARIRIVEALNQCDATDMQWLEDLLDDLETTFYDEYFFKSRNRD